MEIDEQGKKLKLWVRRKKSGIEADLLALRAARAGQQDPRSLRAGSARPAVL